MGISFISGFRLLFMVSNYDEWEAFFLQRLMEKRYERKTETNDNLQYYGVGCEGYIRCIFVRI